MGALAAEKRPHGNVYHWIFLLFKEVQKLPLPLLLIPSFFLLRFFFVFLLFLFFLFPHQLRSRLSLNFLIIANIIPSRGFK